MCKLASALLLAAALSSKALLAPAFAQNAPAPVAPAPAQAFVYNFKTPELHRAAIDALLSAPNLILFIDLRRPDEISKIGSFPVYLNVQINDLEKQLDFIPKERLIITVSNHAARAGKAADFLADKGFKVIGAVGSQHYEDEGGKIVKIAVPPPRQAAAPGAEQASAAASAQGAAPASAQAAAPEAPARN
jgi:rhodanese-related sulfurtransferase